MGALRQYKEFHELQDTQELEVRVEAGMQQKEGSEPLTEEGKVV
jgi:hypothetical protein